MMRISKWTANAIFAAITLVAAALPAQAGPGDPDPAETPSLSAAPMQGSMVVDGLLDEAAWLEAAAASTFLQYEPNEGEPATQQTEVRIVYGEANVYIGAVLHDESPDEIVAALGRRDDVNRADWFFVSIDSYFDRKTAYTFGVNAGGVRFDGTRSAERRFGGGGGLRGHDESWDAIWHSDVRITPDGWIVEMRIPYSMLRFPDLESQTWGIHFMRQNPRLGEQSEWPLVPRTERQNMVANYATLDGITGIQPRRNFQVRPYSLSRLHTLEDPVSPGDRAGDTNLDVGADVKLGITSGITLDATFNPDFGQVEVDPEVLNLTAFETRYQEKRPFFIEGNTIYQFSLDRGSDLLYTRRIGAQAPIIGAAKLSGRTSQGTSIGFLGATTGYDLGPERYYSVGRLSQEIGRYSSAGLILTSYFGPEDDLHARSFAGGADWDFRFLDNEYGISGFGVFSRRGTKENGMESTGFAGQLNAERRQGMWQYSADLNVFSPDFNPNDVGQLRRTNYIDAGGSIGYDINGGRPFGPFQRADARIFAGQGWSYDELLSTGISAFFFSNFTLRTFQRIQIRGGVRNLNGGYDLYETRGLGPWRSPGRFGVSLEFSTDDRRKWELQPEAEIEFFSDGGRTSSIGMRSEWYVNSRIDLSSRLTYEMDHGVTAWSANNDFLRSDGQWLIGHPDRPDDSVDPADFVTFDGSEFLDSAFGATDFRSASVFGSRDTRALDLTLRSNFTFNPTMSLQFYGQFFVARGRYQDFQVLADPETLIPFASYPMRDAFSLTSFTANTVFRWEYRPGSRLYLVWTQGRRTDEAMNPLAPWGANPYDRQIGTQIGDTFRVFPENIFLLKLDYTFLY